MVQSEHPHLIERPLAPTEGIASLLGQPPTESLRAYNCDLDTYYERYAQYVRELRDFENEKRLTKELSITLRNTGGCPALDIDICLHFPDGFELVKAGALPEPPAKPDPPSRPLSFAEGLGNITAGAFSQLRTGFLSEDLSRLAALSESRFAVPKLPVVSNVSEPVIERSNSFTVRYHVRELKHTFLEGLGPLYVMFQSFDTASSFGIDYAIIADNTPKETTGRLHVEIQKGVPTATSK